MEDKSVGQILHEQLEQLRALSMSETINNEPELVVRISLAMVEIAKLFNLYQQRPNTSIDKKELERVMRGAIHDTFQELQKCTSC